MYFYNVNVPFYFKYLNVIFKLQNKHLGYDAASHLQGRFNLDFNVLPVGEMKIF